MPVPLMPQEFERWNRVLAAAAKQQSVIPEAFLVGDTAVGIYVPYRTSRDADHLMADLPGRYTEVLARLEALAGWSTEFARGQHSILGRMDGVAMSVPAPPPPEALVSAALASWPAHLAAVHATDRLTYCGTNVDSLQEGGLVMILGPGMKPVVAHAPTELNFPRVNRVLLKGLFGREPTTCM